MGLVETDQQLARHYLAHRASGYSIRYVLKRSAGRTFRTILLTGLVTVTVWHLTDATAKGFALWALGMLMGALVRDLGWLRNIKRHWPFTVKIINWEMVEQLAATSAAPAPERAADVTPAALS